MSKLLYDFLTESFLFDAGHIDDGYANFDDSQNQ